MSNEQTLEMKMGIKVTGTPIAYGDGAIRHTKEGKGRFDLIPPEPFREILSRLITIRDHRRIIDTDDMSIWCSLMCPEPDWALAIIQLTACGYGCYSSDDSAPLTQTDPGISWEHSFWTMLKELAIHFQKGAEIYGERNCQKGIPLWSFLDSAMRHTLQFFREELDERHLIAAIWNLWMYGWTVLRQKVPAATDNPDPEIHEESLEEYIVS